MAELEREGRRFVIATVVRTHGSTPQVVGSRLIVDDLGRLAGTLGGGCVEGDAILEARRLLVEGGSSLQAYDLTEPIAWDTGMVCGGTMWIHIEAGAAAASSILNACGAPPPRAAAPALEDSLSSRRLRAARLALGTVMTIADRTVSAVSQVVIEDPATVDIDIEGVTLSERARDGVRDAFARGVP